MAGVTSYKEHTKIKIEKEMNPGLLYLKLNMLFDGLFCRVLS